MTVLMMFFGSAFADGADALSLAGFLEKTSQLDFSGSLEAVFMDLTSGRENLCFSDLAGFLGDTDPQMARSSNELLWKYNFSVLFRNCFSDPDEAYETLDTDADGLIRLSEFTELGAFYGLHLKPAEIFKHMERPSEGSLSKQDFKTYWDLKNETPGTTKLRSISTARLGRKSTQRLKDAPAFLRRFIALLRYRFESPEVAFDAFDMDGNGRLTPSELAAAMEQLQFTWNVKEVFHVVTEGRDEMKQAEVEALWHFRDPESLEILLQMQDELRVKYNSPEKVLEAFYPGAEDVCPLEAFAENTSKLGITNQELVKAITRELADGDLSVHVDKLHMLCLV